MRRVGVIVTVLNAVALAAPVHAAKKFVAIGDSITAGSTWPLKVDNSTVFFDCTAACDDSPQADRDECGHSGRLDDWLDANHGGGYLVRNRGWGGEETDEAVVRFPTEMDAQCSGSPGDCIGVVLMHGTNDMHGTVSPESARANLGLIVDEAKLRNLDVLLMTIIRRGADPINSKWEAYKDEVLDLAMDENLESVNPWQTLCPNTTCFENNYWWPSEPPCNDPGALKVPGHLDPDGYDVLTDLITAEFPPALPPSPVPTAPAGDISNTTPDFVWPEVPDTRWYELDLDAGTVTWWEAAAHCAAGTCTVNPGVALSKGPHAWKVRGRNLLGMGTWSDDTAFEVWGVPGSPTPADPEGLYFEPAPMAAPSWEPYTWSADPEATDYDIEVSNGGGSVFTDSFTSASCAGSVCAGSPGQALVADSYTWTVQARNPAATGPLSASVGFTVLACTDPTQQDLQVLEPGPVTTTKTVNHCGPVTVGTMGPYQVSAGGDLTVHTRDGFGPANDLTVLGSVAIDSP